jgi:nucleotide-binding universal stress UspA family protein
MFPTRILLATDVSPEATRAAQMAVGLSTRLDSELHLVHVGVAPSVYAAAESEILDFEFHEKIRERAEEEAEITLNEQVAEIREAGGEVAGAHARVGRPDAEIVRVAEEIGAGLVVLGSRGMGPIRRALMGSVSRSVVRHAHCSVLVVRESGGGGELPSKILLAFDGSVEAQLAARAAVEITGAADSELHVLYTMQTERYMPYPGPEVWEDWKANLERAKRHARSWVEGQAKGMQADGPKAAHAHLAFGRPDEEIVKLSEELEAELIVLGSRGLGRMRRALMGSVSDSVVRHAHCSVLVVRHSSQEERAEGTARTLLREMREVHNDRHPDQPLQEETPLHPHLAAERLDLSPEHPDYGDAMGWLEYSGAIVPYDPGASLSGMGTHAITRRGLEILEEDT